MKSEILMKHLVGVNYWASNAGMYMWRNFDIEVVRRDFDLLKEFGVDTVRLFPLWPDFQPVTDALVGSHHTYHLRSGDQPLKSFGGLDTDMMARFGAVLDLAEERGFKVIVGLLTGWMSGRLFVPELLMNKNPLTDPLCIVWECRFIREFVLYFKDRSCIVAWEPGNECNCLVTALRDRSLTEEQAELWISAITATIRAADHERPVYSGMYSNEIDNPFSITMLKNYVDTQTPHPYPLFTPYCSMESLTTMRAALHSAAQTSMYSGVTNQPCLVEEIGTLGHTVISDEFGAEYFEKAFWSSMQYGGTGFLWWCAFDQDKFDFPPYDGAAIERTLGMFTSELAPKPVAAKMKEMKLAAESLPSLSPAIPDAHVILTNPKESWKSAYGAFCLAAQAGATVDFSYKSSPLRDGERYIIPCLSIDTELKFMDELIERIEKGAKLLITYAGGHIYPFEKLTGLAVRGREKAGRKMSATIADKRVEISTDYSLRLEPRGAQVLLYSGEDILLTKNKLGDGEVYFLNAPLEYSYTESYAPCESGIYEIYKLFMDCDKPLGLESDKCSLTYHTTDEGSVAVLVTRFDDREIIPYTLANGYRIKDTKFCENVNCCLKFGGFYGYIELEKI